MTATTTGSPQHTSESSRGVCWSQHRLPPTQWMPETQIQTCRTSDQTCHKQNTYKYQVSCFSTNLGVIYQMLLSTKNSWMKMQPKGRIPPMRELGTGWDSQLWSGISRGIWLVRTGGSEACTQQLHMHKWVHKANQWLSDKTCKGYWPVGENQGMIPQRWEEEKYQTRDKEEPTGWEME